MGGAMTRDLIVLVPDRNMEFAVKGLLGRQAALRIRTVSHDVLVHPEHDPGCLMHGPELLRAFAGRYAHALVMLDRHGCGRDEYPCDRLERDIEDRLSVSGWEDLAAAVVLDPELETWVWSDSAHVTRVLGWEGREPGLVSWLRERGFLAPGDMKPRRPKEAMEEALRLARKARSSAIYRDLAQSVSLAGCRDRAFLRLRHVLSTWFGRGDAG